jgi:hypothetical protein
MRVGHEGRRLGIIENVGEFGCRQPPVERHEHRPEPRAGIEQDQRVRVVVGENRHPIAFLHPELAGERRRGTLDTLTQGAVADRLPLEPQSRLARREGRVSPDDVGEVHSSLSPGS